MTEGLLLSREEIVRSHDYVRPHVEAGYRLHGGYVATGEYRSPRTLVRGPAVERWAEALVGNGGELIDVSRSILPTPIWPNLQQSRLLMEKGLDRTLWNLLTATGIVEARGGILRTVAAPDFQSIVVEDLGATVTGHLNKGLLWAHGVDEAGDPNQPEEGAHDFMWFAVRDMVFEKGIYPVPEIGTVARRAVHREMPEIPATHENFLKLLMNALIIEVRAESLFDHVQKLLSDPDLFLYRRQDTKHAVEIVDRIRLDESIHVRYLQVFLSELRSFSFCCEDGAVKKGAEFIDSVWRRARSFVQPERDEKMFASIKLEAEHKLTPSEARSLLERFNALESGSMMSAKK
jgi:hypothetical protein